MTEARILFLLPVSAAGDGERSVVQEAHGMRELGVDARVATELAHQPAYRESYGDLGAEPGGLIHYYADEEELVEYARGFDIAVATVYRSVTTLDRIVASNPAILPAYYVQDYEPRLFEEGSPEWQQARDSYRLVPGAVLFASTRRLSETLAREHGLAVAEVPPSLDQALFRPPLGDEGGGGAIRVAAMIRPPAPRGGAPRTMRVLERLHQTFGDEIEIDVLGSGGAEVERRDLERDFPFTGHGRLTREQLAGLLRRSHVFVDLSDGQPFARTALEAMASGCAVVVPAGAELATDGENAVVVDTASEDGCYMAIAGLILDPTFRRGLSARAVDDALQYPVARAAASQLALLGCALAERDRGGSPPPLRPVRLSAFIPRRPGATPGSSYVRVLQPLSHPRVASEVAADHPPLDRVLSGRDQADAILVQRTAIPSNRATGLVGHVRRTGRPLIVEIDDHLLLLESDDAYKGQLAGIRALLEVAGLVTVATPHLARAIAAHTDAAIAAVPNALDERLWFSPLGGSPGDRHLRPTESRRGSPPLRILYMGTATHAADLELLEPALPVLREEAGLDVELEVIGAEPPGEGQGWYRRLEVPRGHTAYPHFVRWLRTEAPRWDLAVAPLEDTEFNRSKSDLKFLEYAALGLPSVVSDVEAYRGCRDGVNAVRVANEPSAWAGAISDLAGDAGRRASIARSAARHVREARCLDTAPNAFVDAISRVVDRRQGQPHRTC